MKKTTLAALASALTMAVSAQAHMDKDGHHHCADMNGKKCVSTKSSEGKCGEGKCGAATPK
ncbi:Uncharacterized low-complexity protein [Canicola haemoglobinophilus]|nr:Uncharacterized low-complexity protein [Canicola haemoglobinophilus]